MSAVEAPGVAAQRRLRALIYVRQSHGKRRSIAEQHIDCDRDVQYSGWDVTGRYQDGTSASPYAARKRVDWPEVLQLIEAGGFDVLVLWEPSRAERDAENWLGVLRRCREKNILVRITCDEETFDVRKARHWKRLADEGVKAEYESRILSERLRRGIPERAKQGRPASICPFGYVRDYDPYTREFLRQRPDDRPRETIGLDRKIHRWNAADLVREAFIRVAAGEPMFAIVREWVWDGVPSARLLAATDSGNADRIASAADAEWTVQTLRALLQRRAYIGQRTTQSGVVVAENCWPGLVDEATFFEVQRLIESRRSERPSRLTHMLSHIPLCERSECERAMGFRPSSNGQAHYACPTGHNAVPANELETFVVAHRLLPYVASEKVRRALRGQEQAATGEVARARDQLARLRAELARGKAQLKAGGIDVDDYAAMRQRLLPQITTAETASNLAGVPSAVRDLFMAPMDEVPKIWAALNLATQREAIRLIMRIKVRPAGRGKKNIQITDRVQIHYLLTGPGILAGPGMGQ
jgi:site-specific DNA recombinase